MDWGQQYGEDQYEWVPSERTDCPGFVANHLNDRINTLQSNVDKLNEIARNVGFDIPPTDDQPMLDNSHFELPTLQSTNPPLPLQAFGQQFNQLRPQSNAFGQPPLYRLRTATSFPFSSTSFPFSFDQNTSRFPTFTINRAHFNTFRRPPSNRLAITPSVFHPSSSTSIPVQGTPRLPIISPTIQTQLNALGQPPSIQIPTHSLQPAQPVENQPTLHVNQPQIHAKQQQLHTIEQQPINRPKEMPLYIQPSSLCEICGYVSQVSHVKRHILRVHANSKISCPRCGKSFSTKDDIHRHQKKTKKCITNTTD